MHLYIHICNIYMCICVCESVYAWLCTCVRPAQRINKHLPLSPRNVWECWKLSRSPRTSPPLLWYLCGHEGCVSTKHGKQLQPASSDMSTHTLDQESRRWNTAAIRNLGETIADSWFRLHSWRRARRKESLTFWAALRPASSPPLSWALRKQTLWQLIALSCISTESLGQMEEKREYKDRRNR